MHRGRQYGTHLQLGLLLPRDSSRWIHMQCSGHVYCVQCCRQRSISDMHWSWQQPSHVQDRLIFQQPAFLQLEASTPAVPSRVSPYTRLSHTLTSAHIPTPHCAVGAAP